MNEALLIVFVKNPELGKVKTRLAATIGPQRALDIYRLLLQKTKESIENLPVVKVIYYSNYIDDSDIWDNDIFNKALQSEGDLGEKMFDAFKAGFNAGFKFVGIIGSDCPDISEKLLRDAFVRLKEHNLVIGPATDGGYYFLGMDRLYRSLFFDKPWSTGHLLKATLKEAKQLGLDPLMLETLSDIDAEKDLKNLKKAFKTNNP